MTIGELECPICVADMPLSGDEKKGDEVICLFCGASYRLTSNVTVGEEVEFEEDF